MCEGGRGEVCEGGRGRCVKEGGGGVQCTKFISPCSLPIDAETLSNKRS